MDSKARQKKITNTAVLGIVVNVLIALLKIVIGLAASSIAIISEGVNNATDAGSSFLTLVGTRLSARHPDEKHPFGYGRIEYLTGLVVGGLILFTGFSLFRESVEGVLHPGEMEVTALAIVIVAVSGVVKFFLGNYTIRAGKDTESDALVAVGEECRGDSMISILTIASSLIFLLSGYSLDAWVGVIFSIVIMKSGFEALKSTTSDLIGVSGEEDLAKKLYLEIGKTEGILSVADMMLHNYGPDSYSGSVNVEIDHKRSVGEVYEELHALQLRIMHEYHVTMVFGIYAVDQDSEESKAMRKVIGDFVRSEEHVKSFHALYYSMETNTIYVDFIVDYALQDWSAVREKFTSYMKEHYPECSLELTVETEFV